MPIQLDLTYKKKDGTNITVATGFNSAPMNENYRYVKFAKPTSGNLLTWLETNAVRLPLTGTWVFNSTLSTPPSSLQTGVTEGGMAFTCNGAACDGFVFSGATDYYVSLTFNGQPPLVAYYWEEDGEARNEWLNQAYRTITFTKPVQYEGNEEFIRWFVDNAVPVDGGGVINYLLNDSIRGNPSYLANVSSYDFKKTQLSPLFENVSFKYKGKEFTEIYCSGYLHRSQLSTGSGSTKKYMNTSTLHIDLHFTNGDYTVSIASNDATNRTAWQSDSYSYPSYPTGLDLSTKDIILSFDTAPTGSFLTWLNNNATLISTS